MSQPFGPPYDYVLEEEVDNEVVLLNPERGKYVALNQTASDVWLLSDGESTLEQIVEMLATAYSVEPDEIREDVAHIATEFVDVGLIRERTMTTEAPASLEDALADGTDRLYEVLGTQFRIRCSNSQLGDTIDTVFPMDRTDAELSDEAITFTIAERPDKPYYFDATRHDPVKGRTKTLFEEKHGDRVVMRMIVQFNSRSITRSPLWTAHAGAVARDGRVIAYPASSDVGKSTLTTGLLLAGYDYVTDESLNLDWETGLVVPYPKALWISEESRELLDVSEEQMAFTSERHDYGILTAESLGAKSIREKLPLRDLIFIEREDDREMSMEQMSTAAGVTLLVDHTFHHDRDPPAWFRLATRVAREARTWHLVYSNAAEAVDLIDSTLE